VLLRMSGVIGTALHSIVKRMECGFSFLNWISHSFLAVGLLRSSISLRRALQVDGRRFANLAWLARTEQRTLSDRHRDVVDCLASWLWNRQSRAINSGAGV